MRVIHTRKKIYEDRPIDFSKNKFLLLIWVLSILKWKQLGHQPILYTDNSTLEEIKKYGFEKLYDEINVDLFDNYEKGKNICYEVFWAMPKMLAYYYELNDLGNRVLMCDTDLVPTTPNFNRLLNIADVLVWSNKEFKEFTSIYAKKSSLTTPKGYKFPEWFTFKARPLNTGIIYFKKNNMALEYLDEVFKQCDYKENEIDLENGFCNSMFHIEQRTISEFIKGKNLTYTTMQPINEGLYNKNGCHVFGDKPLLTNDKSFEWCLHLLLCVKECNQEMFDELIENQVFSKEKEYFKENGYVCKKIKSLEKCGL